MYELTLQGPNDHRMTLHYDPHTSTFVWPETGEPLDLTRFSSGLTPRAEWKEAFRVSPANPASKKKNAKSIKIQLGLKCNYACTYCNQRSQPHDGDGNPRQVEEFLEKMPARFEIGSGKGVTIEFWGGEPFVYWKTLKPLAEGVRRLYPDADFNIITNGSLFDQEKVDWLYDMNFGVGISHDGPAYEAGRGADPLMNPEQRRWIRYAFDRLHLEGRIGFNCVLSNKNLSLFAVRHHIAKHLKIPLDAVPLTTEEILLPYDQGGMSLSLTTDLEAKRLTHTVFYEGITNWSGGVVDKKALEFLKQTHLGRPSSALGQKCGMDREENIAVDMSGNVMTCQNTSALTTHKIGHIDDIGGVKLNTAHHWSTRKECGQCPVLQLCQGACLFVVDDYWEKACANSFAYNLGVFASAIFMATNHVLVKITGPDIRGRGVSEVNVIEEGFMDGPLPSWYFDKKTFPIPVVSQQKEVVQ